MRAPKGLSGGPLSALARIGQTVSTIQKNGSAGQAYPVNSVNFGLRAALQVSQEWHVPVFPCSANKQPLTAEGFHSASADPAQIKAWWSQWPRALIGVPTGVVSGIIVIDVDPRGKSWYEAIKPHLGAHRWHQTRRGRHLLFRNSSPAIKNSASRIAPGVDVRGNGGYVIWWAAHGGASGGQIGELPQTLRQALRSPPRRLNGHTNGAGVGGGLSEEEWAQERPRVYAALAQLDPDCSEEDWRDIAMALSWATGGSQEGEDIFVQLSRGDLWPTGKAVKYKGEEATRIKYRRFKNERDENITLATIYRQLKDKGLKIPPGRPQTNGQDKNSRVLLIRADQVEEKPVDWLWKGFLARNKFHLLTGSGGVMKSTLTLSLAATITRGGKWPDGSQCQEAANVIIWSGEDDLADTIKPRFRYAGGDQRACYFIKGVRSKGQKRDFDPAEDMEALERICAEVGDVALIVVDPVVSIVKKDNNSASDVRRALAPLISLGMRYNAVILGLQHFTKGSKGRDPAERVLGSGAWVQAARIVLAAAPVDEGDGKVAQRMVLACTKTFHKNPGGFEYTYEEEAQTEIARVVWGKRLEGTAHSIFSEAEGDPEGGSKLGEAKKWLSGFLANGQKTCLATLREAESVGVKAITLRRARDSLRVRKIREGREYFWALPEEVK